MVKQKRSKLDNEVSRLQKNARNKLYRLRKKGAINATMAAEFNPVVPASQFKDMDAIQKRQYAEQLKSFNKRDVTKYQFTRGTEVVIQKEGTPILSTELWEKRIQEAELNVLREANNAKLRKIRENVLAGIPASQVRNIDFIEMGVEKPIKTVIRTTEFKPGAKTNYDQIKARLTTALDDSRILNYRKAIVNKLRDNAVDEKLVKRIEKLSANELAYLHYYTDFTEQVEDYSYTAEYETGHYKPSEAQSTATEAAVSELLQFLGK